MSDFFRYVRLRPDIDRDLARNEGTYCPRLRDLFGSAAPDPERCFNLHQRRLSQVIREYDRPGVAVFALHPLRGIAGHVWLEAADELRAASIGRHGCVDLHLPDEQELSLRHFLVLVRRRDGMTRVRVLDLVTPSGFQADGPDILRALEADGPVVLSAARYLFVVVPTGAGTPWDPNASNPWSTLPRREFTKTLRALRRHQRPKSLGSRDGTTDVQLSDGPVEAEPDQLLAPDELVAGRLRLRSGSRRVSLKIGPTALERGVVLGRYERCAGHGVIQDMSVSRVHAVFIEVEGQAYLIDAGSTLGTTLDGQRIACHPVTDACKYQLATLTLTWKRS